MIPKTNEIAGLTCLFAQMGIGFATWMACSVYVYHWSMILGESPPPLPFATVASLWLARGIPIVAALLMLIGLLVPRFRKCILWWSFAVALIEALILAILMMGLSLPALSITYRLT